MRSKYLLVGVVVAVLFSVTATAIVLAGNLVPANPPASTSSYTLEDIYNRLNAGTAGSESTFTEPSSGPETGTMHTLNDLYALVGEPAPVPKTGQTECYDPTTDVVTSCEGTGQDGEHRKGVAWPNPRFTDNGNGTVTDNLTGLIWLENANCTATTKNWATALLWANGLYDGCATCGGTNNDCGLSDGSAEGEWRLSNVRELQSLIDYGKWSPALPSGHPFDYVPSQLASSSQVSPVRLSVTVPLPLSVKRGLGQGTPFSRSPSSPVA